MLKRSIVFGVVSILVAVSGIAATIAYGASETRTSDTPLPIPETGTARVLVAPIHEAIDPVTVEVVDRALDTAADEGYDLVLFEMNTPGGLLSSMNEVIERILNDDIPVVIWVTPRNAKAASAGTFIAMASDALAMAPNATIGSASPVGAQGGDIDETLEKKVVNDAVSQITELARASGRNVDWARSAVTDAENLSSSKALDMNVIEFVADSRTDLMDQLHGFTSVANVFEFHTADAELTEYEVPKRLQILKLLINPNWIFLMFTLGIIGIGFEVTHPGVIVPGVVGAIAFILAMYGLQVLPVTTAGVALLALAFALLIAEVFVVSGGALGIGGGAALILGGLMLFDADSAFAINVPMLVFFGVLLAATFLLIGRKVFALQKRRPPADSIGVVGKTGLVREALTPEGLVFVHGEIWSARTTDDGLAVDVGDEVVVDDIEGMTLLVTKQESSEHA